MVKGMGGLGSEGYKIFKQKTMDALLHLRNYRHLILNILLLMIDSGISDLTCLDYESTLTQFNERFLPDLSNTAARERYSDMIDESVNAAFAEAMEYMHRIAVWFKY